MLAFFWTSLIPARGRPHRPHPTGWQAHRPAGRAAHQIRACHQPEDRQGTQPVLARADEVIEW